MGDVPFAPRFRRDLWHARVGEYPPVKKLHDVEWGANDIHILTEDDGLGYRHLPVRGGRWIRVVLVQCAEHGVLALNLVRSLGKKLACRLLAEHKACLAAYVVSMAGCAQGKKTHLILRHWMASMLLQLLHP